MLWAIACATKKNDSLDAEKICDLLRCDLLPRCYIAPSEIRELRRILRYCNLLVREAVRGENKIAGLLMEGGEPYVQEKLHRKKYFYPLVPQLQDAPPSVRELLLISRRRMALCARLERQLLTGLEKHALLQNQAGLQTDLPPRTRLKALRIVVPSVRILSDWKSSEIFSPLTTVLSNKPGTDRVLALRTPDLFGYTWPSDPAR